MRIAAEVDALRGSSVFVAGDVLLDVYVDGLVSRISPEAPVPVLLEQECRSSLGGAANVAANVSVFGARATLSGRLGADREAEDLMMLCHHHGIDIDHLVRSADIPTSRKTRLLAGHQQLARIDREQTTPLTDDEAEQVLEGFRSFLGQPGPKAMVLSDYGKGFLTPSLLRRLLAASTAAGVPIVTDPKSADLGRYRGSTVIKPNLAEGRSAWRHTEGDGADSGPVPIEEVCAVVLRESGARNVVLSLSADGVAWAGADSPGVWVESSHALEVADVSGAGDTMVAFLAMGLAAGFDIGRTVELSNLAAGAVCTKRGTVTLTPSEFLDHFRARRETTSPDAVLGSCEEAAGLAAMYRADEKRVVFANGCFDLLHAGHLRLLQEARRLGDVLILGLNSDASVRRLKGPNRPVQNQEDRAALLAGLACVDAVVIFEEDTPLRLIEALRPDFIVKGGDYSSDSVVGAVEARAWGGQVHIVPLVGGRSSTALLSALGQRR
jgi:D-beta-D-heptose 7-phosphate kinase/D-beta-D-heptose 1-phosphate adenosyltransferase